jgi:peptide/nickel transport system substrate-binding protein
LTLRALVVLTALGVLLSACGDDSSSAGADPEATGTTGGPTTTSGAGGPTAGGDLVVGVSFDAFGLDPITMQGAVTDGYLGLALYDPLLIQTPEGNVEPWLAESFESEDKQTYTVTLHEGVLFQDGTPLDAEAVKINLERHMDPANGSRQLSSAVFIETVTVVDPLTVEIKLASPWAAFDASLAGPLGMIASPAAIAAGTSDTEPVGTGPFMLKERVPQDHTTVVKNPDYWREGEPYLDSINFRVMADSTVRFASLENDEIDVAQSTAVNEMADADEADGLYSTRTPGTQLMMAVNTGVGPVDDVRVREAISRAIDREALNEVLYEGAARATAAFGSEDMPFFDDSVEWPDFDADRARDLVEAYEAEAGPIEFTYKCFSDPIRTRLAEASATMWKDVGIDVELQLAPQNQVVVDVFSGNYTVACLSLGVETADPDAFYQFLYTGNQLNWAKYSNAEMDAALDEGRTSTDDAVRAEAYSTVQSLMAADVPYVRLLGTPWGWMARDEVHIEALHTAEFNPSQVYFRSE